MPSMKDTIKVKAEGDVVPLKRPAKKGTKPPADLRQIQRDILNELDDLRFQSKHWTDECIRGEDFSGSILTLVASQESWDGWTAKLRKLLGDFADAYQEQRPQEDEE